MADKATPIPILGKLRRWLSSASFEEEKKTERWIVMDAETSGLDSEREHLLSIGAIALVDREIVVEDSFEATIRQRVASRHENIVIHGITGSQQRSGQAEPEVLRAFETWRMGAPILGWHIGFDMKFLRAAFARNKINGSIEDHCDLAPLAQMLLNDRSNNLEDYLTRLGIKIQSRHNAAADAWMTALLAAHLSELAFKQGARDFKSLRALTRNARWSKS